MSDIQTYNKSKHNDIFYKKLTGLLFTYPNENYNDGNYFTKFKMLHFKTVDDKNLANDNFYDEFFDDNIDLSFNFQTSVSCYFSSISLESALTLTKNDL